MDYFSSFFISLIFTCAVETIVLWLILRKFLKLPEKRIGNSRIAFFGIFASFATLPYVWFVFPALFSDYFLFAAFSEAFAVLVEAAFYAYAFSIRFKDAFLVSLLANAVSFLLGFALIR
jgi:hypothetical protein